MERGKISDFVNPSNGSIELRMKALEHSNKLRAMGVTDINYIERVYTAGDFVVFNDILKLQNWEYGIDANSNTNLAQIIIAEVPDRRRGYNVFQAINISDSEDMKQGDVFTLDPTQEGKEKGTEWDEQFVDYCISIVKEEMPNIDEIVSKKDIMKGLGLNTYEDLVYLAGKKNGFEQEIKNRIKTPGAKKLFFAKVSADTSKVEYASKDTEREMQEEPEEEEAMTIEEASQYSGIEVEKLEAAFGKDAKIVGVRTTTDIEGLERQLQRNLGTSSKLTLFKVAGQDSATQNRGYVLNEEGTQVYADGESGSPNLISDLVKDGSNGDNISDIDQAIKDREVESKQIKYKDPVTGEETVEYAEKGTEKEIAGYESDAKDILNELEDAINAIENSDGRYSEKLNKMGEAVFSASQKLGDLQVAYGILEPQAIDSLESRASDYWTRSEEERMKEALLEAGQAVVGAVAGAVLGEDSLMRNSQREDGYGDTIEHYGRNLEDPFEKRRQI